MSFLDSISGLLGNLSGGGLTEQETHAHYDQMARHVPPEQIGSAVGPALSQLNAQDIQQRVTNSASQMSPQQKGGLVEQLLGALGGSGGNLGAILNQLGINQDVANNPQAASAEDVGKLAAHTKESNPSVFQRAMSIYSEHPTLVKALGGIVIAEIAKHLSSSQTNKH